MQVRVRDWLIVPVDRGGSHVRRGQVVVVPHPDGTPPYRVRWLADERESLLVPPPDTRLGHPSRTAQDRGGGRCKPST
jgi:Domain of unknown function (DUF1918)